MRKIAILAMLAIVMAMVPAATTGSVGASATSGTVEFINGIAAGATNVDVYVSTADGFIKINNFNASTSESLDLAAGNPTWVACTNGSNSNPTGTFPTLACVGPAGTLTLGQGKFALENEDEKTAVLQGAGVAGGVTLFVSENDTHSTDLDQTRFTLHIPNLGGGVASVCINGEPIVTNVGTNSSAQNDFDSSQNATTIFYVGAPFVSCTAPGGSATTAIKYASGTNFVRTFTASAPTCEAECVNVLIVGEEKANSSQSPTDFCAVLTEAQNIPTLLEGLVAGVEVGNVDTYPDPLHVREVILQISEILETGNSTVPDAVADAWYTSTKGFAETGIIAAAGYSFNTLPQSDLEDAVNGIRTPPADTPAEAAATDALAAYFVSTCIIETPEISFTG